MARSILTVVEENLDPRSTANALYEVMVDWRTCVIQINQGTGTSGMSKRLKVRRRMLEKIIGRFLNKTGDETRELLSQHFFEGRLR